VTTPKPPIYTIPQHYREKRKATLETIVMPLECSNSQIQTESHTTQHSCMRLSTSGKGTKRNPLNEIQAQFCAYLQNRQRPLFKGSKWVARQFFPLGVSLQTP